MQVIYRSPNSEEEFEEYFSLRWQLLRKPLGLERGSEQDAIEKTALHIAAFHKEIIIGVGRLQIENDATARIRYMAVDDRFSRQGVGSRVLEELEHLARIKNAGKCWLYARETAVTFYLKNNYEINSAAASDLEIPHQRMQKIL